MQPVIIKQDDTLVLALMLALVLAENPQTQHGERKQEHTSVNPVPPEDLVRDTKVEQTHSELEFGRRRRSTRWTRGGDDRVEVKT